MDKLRVAHEKIRRANAILRDAIKESFPIGSEAVHTKGGRPIAVQVEMFNSDSIKVWNPATGKTQWVHYFHFLPKGNP